MAVYCEKRTDEELLRDIGEAGRVLLVGCPVCPNFSSIVHQEADGPVSKMGVKGIKPLRLEREMNRTAEWLRQEGVSADSWTLPGMPASFCAISEPTRRKLHEKAQDSNAVVVFSCESGHECVEGIVPQKKVVAAMHAKGLLRVVTRRRGRAVFADKDSAEIIKFTLD
jgi:hypothetical protein